MGHQEEFLHGKHEPTLAQAAQGTGGVTSPGMFKRPVDVTPGDMAEC